MSLKLKKMTFIENVNQAWRFWSLRLSALGTAVLAVLMVWPDAALQAWLLLPGEFKQHLPQQYLGYLAIAIFIGAMFARVVKQTNVTLENKNGAS